MKALSTLAALLLAVLATASAASAAPLALLQNGRVVVLGFDGAGDQNVARFMDEDTSPHMDSLRALRDTGTFAGLRPPLPPESPVAWAVVNTGRNPGETNVPGFVRNAAYKKGEDGSFAGTPIPSMGHLIKEPVPIEEFEHVPIPSKSAGMLGGLGFGVVFVLFFVVFALLLRMSKGPAIAISLLLGLVGGAGGYFVRGYLPSEITVFQNPTQGPNFWDVAASAGKQAVVVDAAMAFGMDTPAGARVLAGFGLPDARGGIGEWSIYTDDQLQFDRPPRGFTRGLTGGTIFRIDERDGKFDTNVYGPVNFWQEEKNQAELDKIVARLENDELGYQESADLQRRKRELEQANEKDNLRIPVPMTIERIPGERSARVTIGGEEQVIGEKEWSDFYSLTFPMNPLLQAHGITRVSLLSYDEPFKLLVNVMDLDPANPTWWQPISTPIGFSAELADAVGPYETYGWPSLTMPYKDEEITPETMMQDLEFTMKWREKLVHHCLDNEEFDLFFGVFSITDRVQHMMYQYYDPDHPMYDPVEAAVEFEFFGETITRAEAVPAVYRQMGRIVGDVMAKLGDDDVLMLCADHGFQSFRWQVDINAWLAQEGYLVYKDGVSAKGNGSLQAYVDWSRTKAYAFGMGYVYLNLQGRETAGIVAPAEADALKREIRDKLVAAEDPNRPGKRFCDEVYVVSDIHSGDYLDQESDLLVGFAPGYRVSWGGTGGGTRIVENDDGTFTNAPVTYDNDKTWSGGHVSVDPDHVRGIFFCNKRLQLPADGPDALHVAPTVLHLMGLEPAPEMDLPPLELLANE